MISGIYRWGFSYSHSLASRIRNQLIIAFLEMLVTVQEIVMIGAAKNWNEFESERLARARRVLDKCSTQRGPNINPKSKHVRNYRASTVSKQYTTYSKKITNHSTFSYIVGRNYKRIGFEPPRKNKSASICSNLEIQDIKFIIWTLLSKGSPVIRAFITCTAAAALIEDNLSRWTS